LVSTGLPKRICAAQKDQSLSRFQRNGHALGTRGRKSGEPDLRNSSGCHRGQSGGSFVVLVFNLVFELIRLDEGDARNGFAEKFPFVANPYAVDAVFIDSDDGQRLAP